MQNQLPSQVSAQTPRQIVLRKTVDIKKRVLSLTMDRAADAFDVINELPEIELRPSYKRNRDGSYQELAEFWALVDDEVVSMAGASFAILEPSNRILRITTGGIIIEDVNGSYDTWDRIYCDECLLQLPQYDFELLNSITLLDDNNNEVDYFVTEACYVYLSVVHKDQYLRRLDAKLKLGANVSSSSLSRPTQAS